MRCRWWLFFTTVVLFVGFTVRGQDGTSTSEKQKLVYVFAIEEDIFAGLERKFDKAMAEADSLGADVFVIRMDTRGGEVWATDRMRVRLLNEDMLTIAYIVNNAYSAGALLSIACDSIYMKQYAVIGAATVVDEGGTKQSEKIQSGFRGKFRATASHQGRDSLIAEAMVDERIIVPGLDDSTELLTFTASEALQYNFCDGIVDDLDEALQKAGISDYRVVEYEASTLDAIVTFFTNPVVSSILLMLIFFGLFFELQSPGIGFALVAAITGAVLYFVPLYIDGLAENWEILVFVIGVVLIGLELFVIPGFGVAGILGITFVFIGLVLSLIENVQFNFRGVDPGAAATAIMVVLIAILGSASVLIIFARRLNAARVFRPLILSTSQQADEGYNVDSFRGADLIGKEGLAVTVLRPSGKIEIDGERYDAFTEGEFAERGDTVKVIRAKGTALVVERMSSN